MSLEDAYDTYLLTYLLMKYGIWIGQRPLESFLVELLMRLPICLSEGCCVQGVPSEHQAGFLIGSVCQRPRVIWFSRKRS